MAERSCSEWGRTFSETKTGFSQGPVLVAGALSLAVFVVTAGVWLVSRVNSWPDGYWPWMLSLGFFLGAVAFFLNFHQMRIQRDAARDDLTKRLAGIRYRLKLGAVNESIYPGAVPGRWEIAHGIELQNGAKETIEYEIEKFEVVVDGCRSGTFSPHATQGFLLPETAESIACPSVVNVVQPGLGQGVLVVRYRHADDGPWFRYRQTFETRAVAKDTDWPASGGRWFLREATHSEIP